MTDSDDHEEEFQRIFADYEDNSELRLAALIMDCWIHGIPNISFFLTFFFKRPMECTISFSANVSSPKQLPAMARQELQEDDFGVSLGLNEILKVPFFG